MKLPFCLILLIPLFYCLSKLLKFVSILFIQMVKVKLSLGLINQPPRHGDVSESRGIGPQFLTLALDGDDWSVLLPGHFTPRETSPVSIRQEAGWSSVSVWTLWRRENLLPLKGI
jgi:hypothetical protein